MAEAMTVETVVEAEWHLQGYWTKLRFPFKVKRGWSDIDILAYHPEKHHLVIAESKVRGSKKVVFAYTDYSRKKEGSILDYDDKGIYFSFLKNIRLLCLDGVIFADFKKMVKTLTIQLVSNYYIDEKNKNNAQKTVDDYIEKCIPLGIKRDVKLDSTLDVILRIMHEEDRNPQERRYGHPIIDLARELNRYMHPEIHYAGRGSEVGDEIKRKIQQAFSCERE